jgi:hypothetical protein
MEGKVFEIPLQEKIAHYLSIESQCSGCDSTLKFSDKSYFHNMYYGEFCLDCYNTFLAGKLPFLISNADKIPEHEIIS